MPPRKITDRLIVIVSAAVFAVFAQQAGADQNLHCCPLRFSDTESFPYSTTLLGIEKEDFAFSANRGYVRRIFLNQIALFNPFLCAKNTNRPRLLFRVPACFQLENAQ